MAKVEIDLVAEVLAQGISKTLAPADFGLDLLVSGQFRGIENRLHHVRKVVFQFLYQIIILNASNA